MQLWERALWKFLKPWQKRSDVQAAMLGGSYAHGTASHRSDIDIHIILEDSAKWRERGNKIVDGFLIEYFANPVRQLKEYLNEDYQSISHADARMFATGKILFDKTGILEILKKNAQKELKRKFMKMSQIEQELAKYSIWDEYDNLCDLHIQNSPLYAHAYHLELEKILTTYRRFLGVEISPISKRYLFFVDQWFRRKYRINKFPDTVFTKMFLRCLKSAALKDLRMLLQHVHTKMGGFEIDGWSLRTKTTV